MTIKIDALAQPTEPIVFQPEAPSAPRERTVGTDWQRRLPVLRGAGFHLRELRHSDAASLCLMLTTEEVSRFVTQPPNSVDGFEEFIEYAQRRRRLGEFLCFAVVPDGLDTAVGVFQLRALDPQFSTAEWGFALGSPFWGTGLFQKCAELVIAFAFDHIGAHRLEARAMAANGRGNNALRKLGAQREAVLRHSMAKDGVLHDEHLWAIIETDWRHAVAVQPSTHDSSSSSHAVSVERCPVGSSRVH
jgi:ribosomal-protein-alanine N-acetyltransferase